MGELGSIISAAKMFPNLLRKIFASREENFVSATMFGGVGKLGNIDRKQNVSATMCEMNVNHLILMCVSKGF